MAFTGSLLHILGSSYVYSFRGFTKFGIKVHCNKIIGTNIDSICKSYVILSIRYIPRKSIDKSYRIPRYVTDRQNYIGFTYRNYICTYNYITV